MVPFGGRLSPDSRISPRERRDVLPPRQEMEATARILFVSQIEEVREHLPALLCLDLKVNKINHRAWEQSATSSGCWHQHMAPEGKT